MMHKLSCLLVSVALTITVLRAEPQPSDSQKQWALATTAIRTSQNGDRHDILGGQEKTAASMLSAKERLRGSWSIDSREDLFRALDSLARQGHRAGFEKDAAARYSKLGKKSLLGWDYTRYIALC